MSSNFGQIGPQTTESAAFEHLKITPLAYNRDNGVSPFSMLFSYLRTVSNILMTLLAGLQVGVRCPFVYLFDVSLVSIIFNAVVK